MRKTKFWKWITNIKVISVLIVVAATGMGVLGVHQAQEYERSTLAIYAEQQDAYVQLVLDQINLLEDHIVDVLLDSAAMGVNTVEQLAQVEGLLRGEASHG